ncbi:MAG: DUF58 domain-containing protein [Verrucomicrobiota bacterium]
MIPKEWLRKIRRLELRTTLLVETLMAGQYRSAFKGRGMDFDEVRPYEPGDDVRRIDWNVTARTGVVHIKKYVEERALTVLLLVDVSASGQTGSLRQSKRETAAELAAILGFSAVLNNDRVGLLLFTEQTERYLSPRKSRQHVLAIIDLILTHQPKRRGTNLTGALNRVYHAHSRKAVIFLLSDFMDQGYERALKVVGRKHDLIGVPIIDPSEEALPNVGWIAFEDSETGEVVEINTADPKARAIFAENAGRRRESIRQALQRAGLDQIVVELDQPYLQALARFFHLRHHRLHP